MATINTMTTGPGTLTIGEKTKLSAMAVQVLEAELKPKVKQEEGKRVLSGDMKGGDRTETWTLEGKMLQDWGVASSVSEFLFDNRGQDMPFNFVPAKANGTQFAGTVTVEATSVGGKVGEEAEADFEFNLVGVPVKSKTPGA